MSSDFIITAYFKAVKHPERKQRYDILSQGGVYELFESALLNKRNPFKGKKSFNYGKTPKERFNAKPERLPDYCISRGGNISSVYQPNLSLPFAWGDVQHPKTKILTQDAILFVFNPDYTQIELFICSDKRSLARQLYQMLCDGLLDNEILFFRNLD